jgi:hypothetical protein
MPDRAREEDELSPILCFSLDLWQNICTHLKSKRLISLTTYFKIYIYIYSDYYRITIVICTYKRLSTSQSASTTRALSHSCISCPSATCFDFQMCFFEGHDSSSINSTSRVTNSVSRGHQIQ